MALILTTTPGTLGGFSDANWGFSRDGADAATPIVVTDRFSGGSGRAFMSSVISDGTTNTYRAELSGETGSAPAGTNRALTAGMERWIGFSVLCASENPAMTSFFVTLFQLLSQSSALYGFAEANLHISMSRGKFVLTQGWDTTLDAPTIANIKTIESIPIGTCERNRWYRFAVHLILNNAGNGTTEVFIDGTPVYLNNYTPNGYNNTGKSQYLKFGNYTSSWKSAAPAAGVTTVWLHDHFVIGDSTSSLAEVMAVPSTVTPLRATLRMPLGMSVSA